MSNQAEVQGLAELIARQGQDALLQRLRGAYTDAAAAHSDIVAIDPARIEAMVQAAAERADGLQWRRALATVAAEQLGISVTEALRHPAVALAQELAGAPSYEQSLSELGGAAAPAAAAQAPLPAPVSEQTEPLPPPVSDQTEPLPAPVSEQTELFPVEPELPAADAEEPEAEPEAQTQPQAGAEPEAEAEPEPAAPLPEPRPGFEPPPGYVAIASGEFDEEEILSSSLEAVAADDALFDLLPPVDPGEFEQDEYEDPAAPTPAEALEAAAPDPYIPADPSFTPEEVAGANMPTQAYEADPHATQAHDMAAEFAAQDSAEQAPWAEAEAEAAEQSYEELAAQAAPETETEAEREQPSEPELHVTAIHLGGVANLATNGDPLDLRLSAAGLDLLQPGEEIVGRLQWPEIDMLEASTARGRRLGKSRTATRLVVRTRHGDASFEIPEITVEDLRTQVDVLTARFGGSS